VLSLKRNNIIKAYKYKAQTCYGLHRLVNFNALSEMLIFIIKSRDLSLTSRRSWPIEGATGK